MQLATARKYAEGIVEQLAPMCERVEIAGSIRRDRPECNDIDLVVMPKRGMLPHIRRRCLQSRPHIREDGNEQLKITLNNGVRVDVYYVPVPEPDMFIRQEPPWGTRLLMRTGSERFNRWFAYAAGQKFLHWNPYFGLYRGQRCVACATEQDMFNAIDVPYIKPEDRER